HHLDPRRHHSLGAHLVKAEFSNDADKVSNPHGVMSPFARSALARLAGAERPAYHAESLLGRENRCRTTRWGSGCASGQDAVEELDFHLVSRLRGVPGLRQDDEAVGRRDGGRHAGALEPAGPGDPLVAAALDDAAHKVPPPAAVLMPAEQPGA